MATRILHALVCLALGASFSAQAIDVKQPEVKEFVSHMASAYGYPKRPLRKLLASAQVQPAILEAMERPAEKAKQWFEYRPIFLTDKRIGEGIAFWLSHRAALERASARSGVPPEYLAAIVGVETFYGKRTGNYRVLDALSTLAFDYPPRSKFFRSELEQYLLLTREAHLDPRMPKGSYAGAMGAPQFMPSNYRKYAVDADANGRVDLWNDWPDVLSSVGNYLKEFGWITGEPVLSEASATADRPEELDGRKLALDDTVGSLRGKGIQFDGAQADAAPAMLIAADEADGTHWRVGYNNFFVITRYNHSALYAMAVYELASALKMGVQTQAAPDPALAPAPGDAGSPSP